MATGSTFDHTTTRDKLIKQAYKDIGALADDQASLTGVQLADGVDLLGLLIRELSDDEVYLHAKSTTSLTLAANTFVYTSANGLPGTISELLAVSYRDASAVDHPVDIVTRERYEVIPEKVANGDPQIVFLTDELTLSARTLYIWPALQTVNPQSVVTGTDANPYKCIKSHIGTTETRPITGVNWRLYWEAGGSGAVAWAADTQYTAPQLLRLTAVRPLYDFDLATHNPDIPVSQAFFLQHLLSAKLCPSHGQEDKIALFESMADKAYQKIFRRTMVKQSTVQADKWKRYF